MNKEQIIMLKAMLEWDDEYRYGYDYLMDDTGLDKKILVKNMKELKALGYVSIGRGGINDDGELTGGTGFYLAYENRNGAKKIIEENDTNP